MKRAACVSFKAHLFCMGTTTGTKKVGRFIQPRFVCNPRDISSGENKGVGICKGFDWTQQNTFPITHEMKHTGIPAF
jgi:hypothetical protein